MIELQPRCSEEEVPCSPERGISLLVWLEKVDGLGEQLVTEGEAPTAAVGSLLPLYGWSGILKSMRAEVFLIKKCHQGLNLCRCRIFAH